MVVAAIQGERSRVHALDVARAAALLCMVIYHFTWDLEMFGLIPAGTMARDGWVLFAKLIAGSFLFLAGVSLSLAHADGIKWKPYLRRLATITGAAALISAVTYVGMREHFIYFGILHMIAAASLLGLFFLRLPAVLTLAFAGLILVAPDHLQSEAFNTPWLFWLGLATEVRPTLDYEPVFPWLAPALGGIATARLAQETGLLNRPTGGSPPGPMHRLFAWAGRHSLLTYLLHQPILVGLLWLATRMAT